ncbi:hypothetical protein [Fangia hongkongensis]|uniref:hypothetical protein n=1 Tax=Fangia hongkongensis TaxID=270495 RepID=UPI00036303F6|nr:hypothetical protein [Fangia hongkongensis]MBK2125647.1 hypothetical protein [Fangia hongkongensis]
MRKKYGYIVVFLLAMLASQSLVAASSVDSSSAIGPDDAAAVTSTQTEQSASKDKDSTSSNDKTNDKAKDNADNQGFWNFLKGTAPENAVFLGMFTWHFNPESRKDDRASNNLVGGLYNSIFFGTLLNSFSDRAFVVGVQRDLYTHSFTPNSKFSAGYRIGIITGYDQRMADIARYLPALPFPELYIDYAYHNIGVELSYVGVVATAKFFIRF